MAKIRRAQKRQLLTWVAELPISFYIALFLHFVFFTLLLLSVTQLSGAEFYRFWDMGAREPEHLIWTLMICFVLAGYFLLVEAYNDLKFSLRRLSYLSWTYGLSLVLICGDLVGMRGMFFMAPYANDAFGESYQVQYVPTYVDVRYNVTPETIQDLAFCKVDLTVSIWDKDFLYGALSPWRPVSFDARNVRVRFPDFFDVEVILDQEGIIRVDRPYFEGLSSQRSFDWLLRQLDRQAREQGCDVLKGIPAPPWLPRIPNRLHNQPQTETVYLSWTE